VEIPAGEWMLRPWTLSDAAALVKYANNRNVSRWLRDVFPYPYTAADAQAFLSSPARAERPTTTFAIASPLEAMGGIGIQPQADVHRRSAEIGYWLGEPFWGRGIATLAVQAMCAYAFATFEIVRLYAHVFEGNIASCRVLEKAGFTLEGRLRKSVVKDGRVMDSFVYAKVRE
jgi:RimJ/RimL family protein N-acetyltransferase